MDEESTTTVALSFLLRGRWYNTAILSFTLCMHECVGKLRNITKLDILCFSPSLAVVILSTSRK